MSLRRATQTTPVRARRRETYLDAAEALVEEGVRYVDVAIGGVAQRAGFSRASFYAYFDDKRALALAVAERFQARLASEVGAWLRGEDDDSLTGALTRTIAVFDDSRGAVLLIAEAAAADDEIAVMWRAIHAEFERLVRLRLESTRPDLSPDERAAHAFVCVWSMQAVIIERLRSGRLSRIELARTLAELWASTLDAPAPGGPAG
jgi:TetR/AcrR family transcriptional regulator, ethionamide resistance regulator